MPVHTRFAPSPTGRIHLGHARAAFEVFSFVDRHDGTCLLRIEDIDHTRCRPEYTRGIYEDLDWLGLDWPLPVRVQSAHYRDYADVVLKLLERGLVYPCTLTRSDIKAGKVPDRDRLPSFPDRDLEMWSDCSLQLLAPDFGKVMSNVLHTSSKQEKPTLPFAIRLDLKTAIENVSDQSLIFKGLKKKNFIDARESLQFWANSDRPDPILARRDIGTSYDIAVTHDDALQNITHVVRGKDLFDQTPLHVLIQTLMGWPVPTYYHHDLVLREDGEKLAKRNLDTSLMNLREAGQSVAEIKRLAGVI